MSDPAQQALAESGTSGGTSPAGALESRGHEASAISLRTIVKFLIWFIAVAAVVHLIVWGLFVMQRGHERARDVSVTGVIEAQRLPPPEPRLQPSPFHHVLPHEDLEQLQKQAKNSFAKRSPPWTVDPVTGEAQIPDEVVNQVAKLPHAAPPAPATRPLRQD